jgi:hypothetical protein
MGRWCSTLLSNNKITKGHITSTSQEYMPGAYQIPHRFRDFDACTARSILTAILKNKSQRTSCPLASFKYAVLRRIRLAEMDLGGEILAGAVELSGGHLRMAERERLGTCTSDSL